MLRSGLHRDKRAFWQGRERAGTRVVEAGTVKQVAKVYARMLNYTAYKTADADFLSKKVRRGCRRSPFQRRVRRLGL